MLDLKDIEARQLALSELMREQLGVRGRDFEHQVSKAGRLLPGWVRNDAARIIEAGKFAGNPKLSRRINPKALKTAEARIIRYLEDQDPVDRRTTARLRLLATVVLNVLIVLAGLVLVARWQGLI